MKSLNLMAHKVFLTSTVRQHTPSTRNFSERKALKGLTKILHTNIEYLYKYFCIVSSKMRFRQEALKEAYKLRQKAWQLDGKPQQGSFLQQNTQAQVSLFVPENASKYCAGSFWNRVYSLIKSLFSSRSRSTSLSTHISKAFKKCLGLHIFLTPNEKPPGWSCEYCPCYRDLLSLKIPDCCS